MESKAGNTRDVPNTIPGILIYTVRFGEVPGRQEPTHSVYRHQHRAEAPLRNERIATTFSPDTTVAAVGRDWFVMTGRGDLYKNDEKFLAKNLEIPRPAFTVDQTSGDWYAVQWKGTHNDALRGLDGHALDAAPEVIGQNFTAGTRIAAAFGNWFVTTAKGTIVCVCVCMCVCVCACVCRVRKTCACVRVNVSDHPYPSCASSPSCIAAASPCARTAARRPRSWWHLRRRQEWIARLFPGRPKNCRRAPAPPPALQSAECSHNPTTPHRP